MILKKTVSILNSPFSYLCLLVMTARQQKQSHGRVDESTKTYYLPGTFLATVCHGIFSACHNLKLPSSQTNL